MDDPLLVEATRAGIVEAVHRVHAVAVADGKIVAGRGDARLLTFLRSSAKPFQALQLARSRPELDSGVLAIACASHAAKPEQLAAVRALLAAAPASEEELETGPTPTPLEHTCSGKHAGLIAACRARGLDPAGYTDPGHAIQRAILGELAEAVGVDPAAIPLGIDGCGVPTFALPLDRCAALFGLLPQLDGGRRVLDAMAGHPELLRGPVPADAAMAASFPGWVGKGGAEGLLCACSDDGLAVALKVEDGATRAILPAFAVFLAELGLDAGAAGDVPLENSRGEHVGTVRVRRRSPMPEG